MIAQVGINSSAYVARMLPPGQLSADTAVISLGVNDGDTYATADNLRLVRSRVRAGSVFWLLPGLKSEVRDIIATVASEHGDRLIDTRPFVGRDHLHPNGTGYRILASFAMPGGNSADSEVAYAPSDDGYASGGDEAERPAHVYRHRSAYITPRERIRRLRALRAAEIEGASHRHPAQASGAGRAQHVQSRAEPEPHAHAQHSASTRPERFASTRAEHVTARLHPVIEPRAHACAGHGRTCGRTKVAQR